MVRSTPHFSSIRIIEVIDLSGDGLVAREDDGETRLGAQADGPASPENAYAEFRVRIERGPTKRSYRILASGPSGQVEGRFKLPFSDLELENFVLKVGGTRKGVRSLGSPEMELAKSFGGRLFGALFETDVRGLYRASAVEAKNAGQGLRITLALTSVPELLRVPWEYLYDRPLFPCTDRRTPIVRYLDLPKPIKPFRIQLPLRILAIVSAPIGAEQIDAALERTKLEEALAPLKRDGAVAIDWLEEASLSALYRLLSSKHRAEYHILHFIGHGGYVNEANEGVLLFEDEHGRRRDETGDKLGTLLHSEDSLRLAVLNSCEGARASLNDPFSSVATSLIEHEIPAVIGMQFEITDRAAILFSGEFYAALADGRAVDESVSQARMAIFADNNDIEWGTPVLFMRVTDGRLFEVEASSRPWSDQSADRARSAAAVGSVGVPSTVKESDRAAVWSTMMTRRTLLRAAVGAAVIGATGIGLWGLSQLRSRGPLWVFETGDEVYSSPTVVDGVLYIGSVDRNLYAVDASTGTERWRYTADGAVTSSPAVADGTVYVGSNDMRVHAVDALSGARRWIFDAGAVIHSSPAVDQGVVYVGSRDHNVYAIDAQTGQERWRFTGGDWFNSSPTVSGDAVYIGCRDHRVYALETETGVKRWEYTTRSSVDSSATVSGDTVWIGGDDHDVLALDARTGAWIWDFTAGGGVVSTPLVVERVLYVGSDDGNLYALDATTGRERWRLFTENGIRSSPAFDGGLVYVGSRDFHLYAIDAVTGDLRWRFATRGPVDDSSPAVADDRVFVGSLDHNIYALDATSGAGT